MTKKYQKLSKTELKERLHSLQGSLEQKSEMQTILHELEVYQIELEMQNRELRESQQLLEESHERYVKLYDFAPIGYLTLDLHGLIKDINLTAASLIGSNRENLLEHPLSPWILNSDLPKFWEHLKKCAETSENVSSIIHLKKYDKQFISVEIVSTSYSQNANEAPLFKTIINDLTERESIEKEHESLRLIEHGALKEAEQASDSKDVFLALVSHELRAPLQPIIAWAQLAQGDNLTEMQKEGLRVIEHSAWTQNQIINDLLDISRVISGKLNMESELVDIRTAAYKALDSCKFLVEIAHIEMSVSIEDSPIFVRGDLSRIQQTIWNLLTNAIKFSFNNGQISFKLIQDASFAHIEVRDEGKGIAKTFLPNIFKKFQQADNTLSNTGLGLGLAIARYIIERHGGTIEATSLGEGKGATFTVLIPLAKDITPAEKQAFATSLEEKEMAPDLSGLHVLLVDDEFKTLKVFTKILEFYNARVSRSSSVSEAFEMIAQEKPDVILADIGMPIEDGYVFIKKLRKLDEASGGKIPAAAITCFISPSDKERVLKAGYGMHISKPIEPRALAHLVATLAGRKKGL